MVYQNKFMKVVQKMQNMTLKVRNDRLRSKSFNKRHI